MSVFKEEIHILEGLASLQRQIYPDACDYGVILTTKMKEDLRTVVKSLKGLRSYKVHKWGAWGKDSSYGSSIEVFVAFENDRGMFNGTLVQIDCHVDKVKKLEFATISLKAAVRATS
jgi:hypothetical protein